MAQDETNWLTEEHMSKAIVYLRSLNQKITILDDFDLTLLLTTPNKQFDLTQHYIIIMVVGRHWIVLTNVNTESNQTNKTDWLMYESLNNEMFTQYAEIKNIMSLIYPDKKSIIITKVEVTQQSGHNDCGLFAIAFAQSLCQYIEPGCVEYVQSGMREAFELFLNTNKLQFECNVSTVMKRNAHDCEIDLS
jgi:hypothetical protein